MVSIEARQLVQDYLALQKRLRTMRKEFTEASKVIFHEQVIPLFQKFPKLVSFSWTQYTPYFNDGDPCYFRCNSDDPSVQYGDMEEREECYGLEGEVDKAANAIREFLGSFSDEQYEMMFEDHAEIVVSREGVTVEEYEHD